MKILQKTTWINYLIIGIIYSLLLNSCDIEYNLETRFTYKNLTSENLEIVLFDENGISFKNYSIEPNKEVEVLIQREGVKTGIGLPFRMQNDSRYIAKKVVIKFFKTDKCLTFLEGEGIFDPRTYDNFNESMYNTSNNTLIYSIDNSKLALAVSCL